MTKRKFLKILPITTLTIFLSFGYTAFANENQTEKLNLQENNQSITKIVDDKKIETIETKNEKITEKNSAVITKTTEEENTKLNTSNNLKTIKEDTKDSDGDGILDKDEKPQEVLKWNFSDRDALMFSSLSYREDSFVNAILDENSPILPMGEDSDRISMIKGELAPYWSVKKTFHYDNGFDAIIFENKSKDKNIQSDLTVLAFRGTDEIKDIDDDLALFVGANPNQANSAESLIDSLRSEIVNKNLYITGHSLGGYLALRAHSYAKQKGYDFVKKSYTFNAPKVKGNIFNKQLQQTEKVINELTEKKEIINYKVNNDKLIPLVGFVNGAIEVGNKKGKHQLSSFYEESINNLSNFSAGIRKDITGKKYSFNKMVIQKLKNTVKKTPTKKRVPTESTKQKHKYYMAI